MSDTGIGSGRCLKRTRNPREVGSLERGKPTPRIFDTLQSRHVDERFAAKRCVEAHERRLRTRSRDRGGEHLGGANATRGTTVGSRVTPVRWNGLVGCANPWSRIIGHASMTNGRRGRSDREVASATDEGNPLKAKSPRALPV
ncbi:MAG: hypothetical protein ACQEXJ_03045 [Myxococcota bacterium]